jgi:hypothetical protein
MNLDTQNLPWIDVEYELPNKERLLSLIKAVQLVEADNIIEESYDNKFSRPYNLTIGKLWQEKNVYAEGFDMKPLSNQEVYKDLVNETHKASVKVKQDLKIPEEILFHVGLYIFIPKKTKIAYHVDSFRNAALSFPLSSEGSTVLWKKNNDDYKKIYLSTTVLDTHTPHSVDNNTENDRWLYQLTFDPKLYIDDIRKYFQ